MGTAIKISDSTKVPNITDAQIADAILPIVYVDTSDENKLKVARITYERLRSVIGNGGVYYDYADRTIVAEADRDTSSEVTITTSHGTVYNLHIEQNSDLIHLVDVSIGTSVRLSQDNTLWIGRIDSFTKSGDVWTLKIDFHTIRSTFTTGESIQIEFGAYPISRTSVFYGYQQTERIPTDIKNDNVTSTIGENEVFPNGIKRFAGNADENVNGGIKHAFLNSNNIANADHKQNASFTALRIDESGLFNFRVKGFGNQAADGNTRLRIYKIVSGEDDAILLTISAWHASPTTEQGEDAETVAEYFDQEKNIDVVSGDRFMMVMDDFAPSKNLFAGYLEMEKIK